MATRKCVTGGIAIAYLVREHLPGIHYPVGVEQFLDLFHPFDARLILAVSQRVCLRVPDTMFGGDGPFVRS